ncbi:hypothetical protein BYT27DRAFT_7236712 [Phlegmacium glaucopus]|nr:hypothetical protein BYT27DRAFT_7236712 [Phlegmacium glaucopus]
MPPVPVKTKVSTTKDQYQHYIPRFILRYFQSGTPPSLTKRQRTKSFRKAHKTGVDTESIFYYDVTMGVLQIRPVARVYGRTNLYRDMSDLYDVDHLEAKFSRLENDASVVIKSIHASIHSHKFTTTRKELALLRKFIFLMHYRNDAEDHPENAPLVDWIRKVKKTRGLETDHDVWLHGLKYYLETPHHTIVATAEWVREEVGDHRFQEMLRSRVALDMEDWYAIDYETLANYFFLGIWEAADDSEFVLSGNGFGLWEGLIDGDPGAHRIAIVLRRTLLHNAHPNDPAILYSCLAEIPIAETHVQYVDESSVLFVDDEDVDPELTKRARMSYRTSQKAQEDRFTLGITKLTRSQTYTVNEVLMLNINLHQHGSLSFSTARIMLDTVCTYMMSNNTFLGRKRSLFRPLLLELTDIQKDYVAASASTAIYTPTVDTDADVQLNMLLRFTVMKAIDFPSNYNRAYLIFHMATDGPSLHNAVSFNIRKLCFDATSKLKSFLDPPCLPCISNLSSNRITETLAREESELFFALVGYQVEKLDVGRYTNDLLGNIIYEAAMIGVTHWLAENRYDILSDLLYPWMKIVI